MRKLQRCVWSRMPRATDSWAPLRLYLLAAAGRKEICKRWLTLSGPHLKMSVALEHALPSSQMLEEPVSMMRKPRKRPGCTGPERARALLLRPPTPVPSSCLVHILPRQPFLSFDLPACLTAAYFPSEAACWLPASSTNLAQSYVHAWSPHNLKSPCPGLPQSPATVSHHNSPVFRKLT